MFTGIVEATGQVTVVEPFEGGVRLRLTSEGLPLAELSLGESVAINGCCLTVVERERGEVAFDLLEETRKVTSLGELAEGDEVNLERALPANGRLSGHFVQGHVDSKAEVLDLSQQGSDHRLEIALAERERALVIPRGSIAIDGISLTAAELTGRSLVCWIIPHTFAETNLHTRRPGDFVNLEFDLIGKYVRNFAAAPSDTKSKKPLDDRM
ncbi:MAG: riboflavin synthase [Verrucomicrobiota bacterium]